MNSFKTLDSVLVLIFQAYLMTQYHHFFLLKNIISTWVMRKLFSSTFPWSNTCPKLLPGNIRIQIFAGSCQSASRQTCLTLGLPKSLRHLFSISLWDAGVKEARKWSLTVKKQKRESAKNQLSYTTHCTCNTLKYNRSGCRQEQLCDFGPQPGCTRRLSCTERGVNQVYEKVLPVSIWWFCVLSQLCVAYEVMS